MATEYDLFHHPQLKPLIQQKVTTAILRVSRICWKVCNKDSPPTANCVKNCTESYIEAYDIVLDEIKKKFQE